MAEHDPLFLVDNGFLSIKTKAAELVDFFPNSAQQELLAKIRQYRGEGKPIRFWVLKARQEGISTVTEAIIYAMTSRTPNVNSLIVADIKDHSDNLYKMFQLYHEQLNNRHPHLAPILKKSNQKILEFDELRSQIAVGTAENASCAKSGTFHNVHLSEVAFFRDFYTLMGDLMQTVPDMANTMIIGETTANGKNFFYKEWKRAISGKTDWLPVFIPWFMMKEYRKPLELGKFYPISEIDFGDMSEEQFLEDEQYQIKKYGWDQEQTNWRRYAIVNKCQGSLGTFCQEYPACWQEAFQVSGSTFFSKKGVQYQEDNQEDPKWVGEIYKKDNQWQIVERASGRCKVYEGRKERGQYIITGDTSEALGQDEASLLVIDKQTNDTVAVVNGQYPPEDLTDLAIRLGYYYNEALIAIENKSYGYMANQLLAKTYGNIYRKKQTKNGVVIHTDELGFNTNSSTRPLMLARMAEEVKERACLYRDKDLISQCWSFVINEKTKKAEAAEGDQDGLVICRAIASQVLIEHPYTIEHGHDFINDREDDDWMSA